MRTAAQKGQGDAVDAHPTRVSTSAGAVAVQCATLLGVALAEAKCRAVPKPCSHVLVTNASVSSRSLANGVSGEVQNYKICISLKSKSPMQLQKKTRLLLCACDGFASSQWMEMRLWLMKLYRKRIKRS